MMKAWVLPLVLLGAACSPPAQDSLASSETASPAAADPIRGAGTVAAVDAAAGTINIDHEPIPAISWPSMSMQFQVENAASLEGIAVGDRVSFELKSADEPQTIVSVQEQ